MRWFLAALLTVAGLVAVPAVASAQPDDGQSVMPADLRQFVGGTDEFKAGPWFAGECADRGGDIGAYASAVFPVEARLMYWTAPTAEDKRALLLAGSTNPAESARYDALIASGQEPPAGLLPNTFPGPDGGFALPSLCKDDAQQWATPDTNTWGFVWADRPDTGSLAAMLQRPGADKVPDDAWLDPCSVGGMYCAHAFFLDCEAGAVATRDRCMQWNLKVADLFAGTANWVDQNTTVGDRVGDWVANAPGFKQGLQVASAFGSYVEWASDNLDAVAGFIADPQNIIEEWANQSKQDSFDLATKVLQGLSDTGTFDPSEPGFLKYFAVATGIGVGVLCIALAFTIFGARREDGKAVMEDVAVWLPLSLLAMLFGPWFAVIVCDLVKDASDQAVAFTAPDVGSLVTNMQRFSGALTAPGLPGGVLVGLVLFLFLLIGALAVYFGLLMHTFALPFLMFAVGLSAGMWCNKRWRRSAHKPLLVFLTVLLSKPLLLLLVGVLTGPLNTALIGDASTQAGLGRLGQLCAVTVGFVILGFGPWTLPKYVPLLPASTSAPSFGGGHGALTVSTVGAGAAAGSVAAHAMRSTRDRHFSSSSKSQSGNPLGPQWLQQRAGAPGQPGQPGGPGQSGGPGGGAVGGAGRAGKGAAKVGALAGAGTLTAGAATVAAGALGARLAANALSQAGRKVNSAADGMQ